MIKLKIGEVAYVAHSICIQNKSGVMHFLGNCANFVGYGNFLFFVDMQGRKHVIDRSVCFQIVENNFSYQYISII